MDGWVWEKVAIFRAKCSSCIQGEPCDTVCNAYKCYCPHHMTGGTFQGRYSVCVASQRGLRGVRRALNRSNTTQREHCD